MKNSNGTILSANLDNYELEPENVASCAGSSADPMRARKFRKPAAIIAALALTASLAVGGTLAYFTATTGTVQNSFVAGSGVVVKDGLALQESQVSYDKATGKYTVNEQAKVLSNDSYTIVPGVAMPKDPTVTMTTDANCAPSYVFVKVSVGSGWAPIAEKSSTYAYKVGDVEQGLSFVIDSGWTYAAQAKDGSAVFYRAVEGGQEGTSTFNVMTDKTVSVSKDIVADALSSLKSDTFNINFKAYAVQQAGFNDAADAWAKTFDAS